MTQPATSVDIVFRHGADRDLPHGRPAMQPDIVNAELLAFFQG
jgi:hypothetical protein